ncbi:hypothetical protein GCM10007877_28310 [Marinibactrum halimedae]|uniref:Type II secretion system protein L n=2 Tax=Marinibactrum halimedae TaxID=1444977 RepID=A0AA37WQF2_9GAMM|nr:hypothetical protein GCM10007877_28310 [Marinibactrum halimedae]
MGPEVTGDIQELKQAQLQSNAEIWLALSTDQLVMSRTDFNPAEKKHIGKLLPYELEDQILGDVEDFHFAIGKMDESKLNFAYVPKRWITNIIDQFNDAQIEVVVCLPEPLLIPWEEHQWTLRWLGGDSVVEVRYAYDLCFRIHIGLLSSTLNALLDDEEFSKPNQIKLFAQTFEDLQTLQDALPDALQDIATSQQWDRWLSQSLDKLAPLNLRQQTLARALPVQRWWLQWKPAVIAAGVAAVTYFGVNWVELLQLKYQHERHLAAAEEAYRSVMPKGAMVDPVRQLTTQLEKYRSTDDSGGPSAIHMLSKITPVLSSSEGLLIKNLYFNDGDMRLNVESPSFQNIEKLRSDIEVQSMSAELINTSNNSTGVQARLRIRG